MRHCSILKTFKYCVKFKKDKPGASVSWPCALEERVVARLAVASYRSLDAFVEFHLVLSCLDAFGLKLVAVSAWSLLLFASWSDVSASWPRVAREPKQKKF
jgi:hypothetical protein